MAVKKGRVFAYLLTYLFHFSGLYGHYKGDNRIQSAVSNNYNICTRNFVSNFCRDVLWYIQRFRKHNLKKNRLFLSFLSFLDLGAPPFKKFGSTVKSGYVKHPGISTQFAKEVYKNCHGKNIALYCQNNDSAKLKWYLLLRGAASQNQHLPLNRRPQDCDIEIAAGHQ